MFEGNPTRRAVLTLPALLGGAATFSCSTAASAELTEADLMTPAALVARLLESRGKPPLVVHVGFHVLYRTRHIPTTVYAGPGNKPEGLEALRKLVAAEPKDREIVIYCGCCPWSHCPNMKPAFALLKQMGFKRAKAVKMDTNFNKDWVSQGYPSESSMGL